MIAIDVPGRKALHLLHGVFDFNGTLAVDGRLREGAAERLRLLAGKLNLHVMTGDTFGTARSALAGLPVRLTVVPEQNQAESKRELLQSIGPAETVAVGNGVNDRLLLADAALGIAVMGREGTASAAMNAADLVCLSVIDVLDLLIHPRRLVATLRA